MSDFDRIPINLIDNLSSNICTSFVNVDRIINFFYLTCEQKD